MKKYNIYLNSNQNLESARAINDGFSVWAGMFGALWAIYYGAWKMFALVATLQVGVYVLGDLNMLTSSGFLLVEMLFFFVIGSHAHELRAWSLKGHEFSDVIFANSETEAIINFFQKNSTLS